MFISFLNILPVTKWIFDECPKFVSALVFNLHVQAAEVGELITRAPAPEHVDQLLSFYWVTD